MSTRFFICLCFFVSSFGLQGQMLWPGQYLLSSSGTLNALDQNQQHLNPAAIHNTNRKGFRFNSTSPIFFADLSQVNLGLFYTRKFVFLYHELSGQFHTALSHLGTTHALALPIGQNLSIGLGMQVQLSVSVCRPASVFHDPQ